MFYRQIFKTFINWSFYLNPVCQKFISNKRVFRKIGVRTVLGLNFILFVYYMTSIQNNIEYDYNTTTIQMGFTIKVAYEFYE